MALEAPGPGGLLRRLAEDGDVVELRIPSEGSLDAPQDALELEHAFRFLGSARRERRGQQGVGRLALRVVHLLQGDAAPATRKVAPFEALRVRERDQALRFEVRTQDLQELLRLARHLGERGGSSCASALR